MNVHTPTDSVRRQHRSLSSAARLLLVCALAVGLSSCTRQWYRRQADHEVAEVLAEKDRYPQWGIEQYHVYPDPRARFVDPTRPDRPPMPPDDPAASVLAPKPQRPGKAGVALIEGTGHLDFLAQCDAENRQPVNDQDPQAAPQTPPTGSPGSATWPFRINLPQSVELGQFNSREFQNQRESLYAAALPVTQERFDFAFQFLATENAVRDWIARQRSGGPQNRWQAGTTLGFNKLFCTGALLVTRFTNQTVINLTRPGRHTTSTSTLSFEFFQPFLRGGGKAATLEPLTQAERSLLYQIRTYARFRKEFFVTIAGSGDGYLPILLRAAAVANEAKLVSISQETLKLFEAMREGGDVPQLQVDQVEQQLLQSRTALLNRQLDYQNALDRFKLLLGVPPCISLELDDEPLRALSQQARRFEELIAQFEAARAEAAAVDIFKKTPRQVREELRRIADSAPLVRGTRFREWFAQRWSAWEKLTEKQLLDLLARHGEERRKLLDLKDAREKEGQTLSEAERQRLDELVFEIDLGRFERLLRDYENQPWKRQPNEERARRLQMAVYRDVQNVFALLLGEARKERLEQIRKGWPQLPPVCVAGFDVVRDDPEEALAVVAQTAIANRFDLMNERARLADAWRRIAVSANGLLGVFGVRYNWDSTTPSGQAQPLNFSGSRSQNRLTLNGELPLVRLTERNAYRSTLIAYQRQRRELMAAEDRILNTVRAQTRLLRLQSENYKIQQRAVELAYFQVENSLDTFRAPPTPQEGASAARAAALTQQLLSAQRSLPQVQNALFGSWIDFHVSRMQLYRDLEIMPLDDRGVWIDELANLASDSGNRGCRGPDPCGDGPSDRQLPGDEDGAERLPQPRTLPPAENAPEPKR